MDEFLHELELLLEWAQGLHDLDEFEEEFNALAYKYRMNNDVTDIANIVAHNYNCYYHNRPDAIINNISQWEVYNK